MAKATGPAVSYLPKIITICDVVTFWAIKYHQAYLLYHSHLQNPTNRQMNKHIGLQTPNMLDNISKAPKVLEKDKIDVLLDGKDLLVLSNLSLI